MPKINLSVPHRLGQAEAKTRLVKLISDSRQQFGGQVKNLKEEWQGNTEVFSFSAMGFDVDGRLDVQSDNVVVDINLPWAAIPFKSRIESEIRKHASELLA